MARASAHGMYYRYHPIYCWRLPKKQLVQVFNRDVITVKQEGRRDWYHPGTKPLKLMRMLVEAWGGGAVCDPFMGSGTTGVAAVELGMHFMGMEISNEPGCFPTAVERIESVKELRPYVPQEQDDLTPCDQVTIFQGGGG